MSEQRELTGMVIEIGETQTFPSGFSKRQLVIETDPGKYPQTVPLDFVKDKADLLDDLNEGDQVKVAFNIRGNEYKGKYYANLEGGKLEIGRRASVTVGKQQPAPQPQQDNAPDDDSSEIPF